MTKLIKLESGGLKCDAPGCGFTFPGLPRSYFAQFIDCPCPDCGANLLTMEDYESLLRLERIVRRLNRWFGWLAWIGGGDGAYKHVAKIGSDGKVNLSAKFVP